MLFPGSSGGWAIKSNFPNLNSGRVFRLDWWIVFYQFIVSMLVVLATLSRVLAQVLPPSNAMLGLAGQFWEAGSFMLYIGTILVEL